MWHNSSNSPQLDRRYSGCSMGVVYASFKKYWMLKSSPSSTIKIAPCERIVAKDCLYCAIAIGRGFIYPAVPRCHQPTTPGPGRRAGTASAIDRAKVLAITISCSSQFGADADSSDTGKRSPDSGTRYGMPKDPSVTLYPALRSASEHGPSVSIAKIFGFGYLGIVGDPSPFSLLDCAVPRDFRLPSMPIR